MKTKIIPFFLLAVLVLSSIACAGSAPAAEPVQPSLPPPATSTPNVQATIDAAMAATAQAQNNMQATVGAAVSATVVALPPTATPAPPVESTNLTEEELEALISQAVTEAVTATTQASTATTQTTSDSSLSAEEVQYVEVYVQAAEQAIYYAEELLQAYYQVYGELAYYALSEIEQVEQELETRAESISALNSTLQEINTTLQSGQAIAQETINQLETAAQTASANLAETQQQVQDWQQQAQSGRENRVNEISAIQPDHVPADLQSTLQEAFSFVDQVKGAFSDNKFSRDELNTIAQLGANVSAGFNQHGGVKMQGMSGKVSEITNQLARGQLPQARSGLGNFETSLGQQPSGGNFKQPQPPGNLPRPSVRP